MDKRNRSSSENLTRGEIGKVILLTLAISGAIALTLVSPGFGHVMREIQKKKFKKYKPYRINQTLERLKKQKLISVHEKGDIVEITLTDKGKTKVLSYKIDEMKLKKGRWDNIWRIIIFDIPESKKTARNFLRSKMKELGFYTLQKSVLVTPWSCRDEIDFIKNFYEVGEFVNLVEARRFDGEEKVKKYFNL